MGLNQNQSQNIILVAIFILLGACASLEPSPTDSTVAPKLSATTTQISPSPTTFIPATPTSQEILGETIPPPSPTTEPTLAPEPENTVRFAVIGDFGEAGPLLEAVATLVKSWNPDLIITTGDNNYPSGAASTIDDNIGQYFHEYIAPYQGSYGPGADVNRFFPTLGNHDWEVATAPEPYTDYFDLPGNERYYDFVWGPVHFFALDSDSREPDGVGRSSTQGAWLQDMLEASDAPWKIVYMHHPPYSSGLHGPIDWMQWPFEEWGAHAVLSGHDHTYERIVIDGFPYFINGLGGHQNRYFFPNIHPDSVIRYRDNHGAMLVEASETLIEFEFIDINGAVIDTYTLEKPEASELGHEEVTGHSQTVTTFPDAGFAQWQPVASGFIRPLLLTHAGDGSGRLFVVEQSGVIRIIQNGTPLPVPFLDITDRVGDESNEQGLLGLAFHPAYTENGHFYLNYTDNEGNTVVARYEVSSQDPNQADPSSETIMLQVTQPFRNHNGGHLTFGPDGYLYVSLGDGGSAGDPAGNAQNLSTILGSILRLDVDAEPPNIPADNPFAAGGGLPEIWAYGLRNPWRFSFDRLTSDLYIGDVGQNLWEEINFLPSGSPGGANFGWDYFEGTHPFDGAPGPDVTVTDPVFEYNHDRGNCSVTGGVVYRGRQLPDWQGVYLFGDFCSGLVWGLLRDTAGNWQHRLLYETGVFITSFGEDEAGEVYLVDRGGTIFQLVAP